MSEAEIIGPDGQVEAKVCVDCNIAKPIAEFQRTPKGGRASDCKVCRRAKYERGCAAKAAGTEAVTKEWIIKEAQKLYIETNKYNDKIRLLDTISRNLNEESRSITDDAKVVRDLIASKKKQKDLGR
jgi:hypothetical protein